MGAAITVLTLIHSATGPVLNPTGNVAVCEGSVAMFICSYIDGSFAYFTFNGTDVSKYSHLNVISSWSGTVLHLEVPGEPWSNKAIIRCVVSGISSDPAVLHVQDPPPLAPRDILIRCLSNDTVQLTVVTSMDVPGSRYWVNVSRDDGTPLLSNTTSLNVTEFFVEGCYQCHPCQVLITSMCDGAVGNSVMVTLNYSPVPTVPPSTSGSSIPVSTNTPTTPDDNTCGLGCIIGIIVIAAVLVALGVFITLVVCIIQKWKRASATITNTPLKQEGGSKDIPVHGTSGTPLLGTSVDASPGHRAFQRNVNSVIPEQPGASDLKSFQKLAQKDTGKDDRECSNGEENAAHFLATSVESLDKTNQSDLVTGKTS